MRYHVHTIMVVDEQPIVSSQMALFFETVAFMTQDLATVSVETMNYSRRCIEACDFVVMVVGDGYGKTNASGVSQLHLSYLTAKSKQKPLLIFIKTDDVENSSRQRQDFVGLLESQNSQDIYYYNNETVFAPQLAEGYEQFSSGLSKPSWSKASTLNPMAMPVLEQNLDARTKPELRKQTDKSDVSLSNTPLNPSAISRQLSGSSSRSSVGASSMMSSMASGKVRSTFMHLEQEDTYFINGLDDCFSLSYRAHAYQEGNLQEVFLTEQVTWRQILKVLSGLGQSFSSDALLRGLNDLVAENAGEIVKGVVPNAHAVSRCQVSPAELSWILHQLVYNNWIESQIVNQRTHREFWHLTVQALQIVGSL